jgi:DNA primase
MLMDSDAFTGEVIFTFDGDAAGMKAAERAFGDDQKFMSQTFVAIEPTGLDPCDLRLKSGDAAVRDLVARRIPLVEFVLRATTGRHDLETAEGRTAAVRQAVPLVARIKDVALRDEYARRLAGLVGAADPAPVVKAVREHGRRGAPADADTAARAAPADEATASIEREVLKVALQLPAIAGPEFDALVPEAFLLPAHQALRTAIAAAGGASAGRSGPDWIAAVAAELPDERLRTGINALAVEPLHTGPIAQDRYAELVLVRLQEIVTGRQVAALKSKLQRVNPLERPEDHARLFGELISLEAHRRVLRDRAIGGQ